MLKKQPKFSKKLSEIRNLRIFISLVNLHMKFHAQRDNKLGKK